MAASIGDRAQRVLRFLLGLRRDGVAAALAPYGFTHSDSEEGWRLLQALGHTQAAVGVSPEPPATVIKQLDAWENHWFPITRSSLARHYPAVQARLFRNLSQTEGPEVTIGVNLFLERLDELSLPAGAYGAEGPKARALLVKRGLTPAVAAEARALLGSLSNVSTATRSLEEEQAELARAEALVWQWYLEWSQVARAAIKNRGLLRQLGFLRSVRDDGAEETEAVEDGQAR